VVAIFKVLEISTTIFKVLEISTTKLQTQLKSKLHLFTVFHNPRKKLQPSVQKVTEPGNNLQIQGMSVYKRLK